MSKKQKNEQQDKSTWTFSKYRHLKPEYPETDEILLFLLDIANGKTTIQVECGEWGQVIPIVEHVINSEKRYTEQQHAVELLKKIAELCPDAYKHQIKHFLKEQGYHD
jgi:hypothetical protein